MLCLYPGPGLSHVVCETRPHERHRDTPALSLLRGSVTSLQGAALSAILPVVSFLTLALAQVLCVERTLLFIGKVGLFFWTALYPS